MGLPRSTAVSSSACIFVVPFPLWLLYPFLIAMKVTSFLLLKKWTARHEYSCCWTIVAILSTSFQGISFPWNLMVTIVCDIQLLPHHVSNNSAICVGSGIFHHLSRTFLSLGAGKQSSQNGDSQRSRETS